MKIIDVCGFYSEKGGGVLTYIREKLAAAKNEGIDLNILVPGASNRIERYSNHCRITYIRSARFPLDTRYFWFSNAPAVVSILDQAKADIVEASSPWKSATIVANWKGTAVRSLFMHADPASAYGYRILGGIFRQEWIDQRFDNYWRHMRRMNAAFDCVICPNSEFADRLNSAGLDKAAAIPMGIEAGMFGSHLRSLQLRSSLLSQCGLNFNGTLLVAAGRFSPEKRWPMVIDAVSKVALDHPVALVLVGDGRRKSQLLNLTHNNPHIQILPHIANRKIFAELLASADGLVHGCEAETFGLVAAEARASGLPLIIPDRGGASDLFDERTDARYRAGNGESLTFELRKWLAEKKAHGCNISAVAVTSPRTLETHFRDLFTQYEKLLGKPKINFHFGMRDSQFTPSLVHASQ